MIKDLNNNLIIFEMKLKQLIKIKHRIERDIEL